MSISFVCFIRHKAVSKTQVTPTRLICQKSVTKRAARDLHGLQEGSVTQTRC